MIYFDNAATTYPKPRGVPWAVYTSFRKYGANPGRAGHDLSLNTSEQVYACRRTLSRMFHTGNPENIAFTLNCTASLNMAIKGILKKGDHVVTSNLEHNAVMRPLEKMSRDGIITYSRVMVQAGNPTATVAAFEQALRPNTRLIVCTHVSNVFGVVLPVEQIGAVAKKNGICYIVDCAQSAGVLPVDLQAFHADCLCMPGHKGLYGPMGTGILICSAPEKLNTIIEGGTGSLSKNLIQPELMPDRFESGTLNVPGIIGLKAGLDFVNARGVERIGTHEMEIARRIHRGLSRIDGVRLYTPEPRDGVAAPVLSFNVGRLGSEQTASLLNESGIAVRAGLHCAPEAHRSFHTIDTGTVRVSPGAFNTDRDADHLIKSVFQIAKSHK